MVIGIPWLIVGNGIWTAGEFSLIKALAVFLFVAGLVLGFLSHHRVYKSGTMDNAKNAFGRAK